ncbi:MAG: hypothetical protein KCHDKBKB_02231 [Elusimicrobia bacterium]|nr:hypothetical protein [Elusimicrobiota bacterium]
MFDDFSKKIRARGDANLLTGLIFTSLLLLVLHFNDETKSQYNQCFPSKNLTYPQPGDFTS